MKKRTYLFVLLTSIISLVFNGCKKSDDDDPSKTELLTGKDWRLTAFTSDPAIDWDGNGTLVTNVFNQLGQCEKDNLTRFLTNSTVNFDEGAVKCDPNDPQTTTGTWAFNSTKTVLSITESGGTSSYNIEKLSAGTLKANFLFVTPTTNYTFTYTWTKN